MSDSRAHILAQRIEGANANALEAHSETAAKLFPDLGATSIAVGGGVAAFMGRESPLSYAVGLGMQGPVTADDIRRVIAFYEAHGLTPRVDVCPLADASLLTELRAQGFQLHWFVNVLARIPLEPYELIAPLPAGVSVRQAKPDEAELWAQVVNEGFDDGPLTEARRQLGLMLFYYSGLLAYFAEMGGEIAGAGSLFTHDGYAALAAASTRPAFRHRGVHTGLIRARLKMAQELNCDVAGLFSMPGSESQRNAERHLFRVVYTKAVMKKG